MNLDKLEIFYIEHHKKILLIPIIVLIIALGIIGLQYSSTGDFMHKDVSLRGGISATINTNQDINVLELEESFPEKAIVRKLTDTITQEQVGITLQVSDMEEEDLKSFLEEKLGFALTSDNYSSKTTGPSLGETFYRDLILALLFAFVFMGVVVFITFRNFAPSLAIIMAAFMDITITLAIVNLFNIHLSTAGIVAFLLLIGYSVDSDILLTTRVLKSKEGSPFSRMIRAAKTGLTMTGTTIAALLVAIIFSTNPTLQQMFTIILIGLFVDIFATYLTNTGILYWYSTRK